MNYIECHTINNFFKVNYGLSSFPVASVVKNLPANAGDKSLIPRSGRPSGEGNDNPVFLPGEFHGQRSLAGYCPWGCKESDMTEQLTHTHTQELFSYAP